MTTAISSNGVYRGEEWRIARSSITFAGEVENGIGDESGTGNPATVFTLTGTVKVKIYAICTTNVTHAADAAISLGITGNTAGIIALTDLTVQEMIAEEIWHDATPDKEIELTSVGKEFIITDGNNIILTVAVADVNTGVIEFICEWKPLSSDGNVV